MGVIFENLNAMGELCFQYKLRLRDVLWVVRENFKSWGEIKGLLRSSQLQ